MVEKLYIVCCLIITLFFSSITIWSRNSTVSEEFKKIIFKKPSINLWDYWTALPFIFISTILAYRGDFSIGSHFVAITYALIFFLDILLQFTLNPNRIYYNEKEVIFLGHFKMKFQTDYINTIKLNGLTNSVSIKGRSRWYASFNIHDIEEDKLIDLINHIKKFNPHVSISENLKKLTVQNIIQEK